MIWVGRIYMGKVNEWELALLPLEQWEKLPQYGIGPELSIALKGRSTAKEMDSPLTY